ncbi:Dicer-like protein 1 [Basidiobolus ranarum]|uniref:Dicer-like protein 1 n=1 Tax=Basidiobolus ranarum TaxID=34480 RepID=A0ABR2X357_9FUNG
MAQAVVSTTSQVVMSSEIVSSSPTDELVFKPRQYQIDIFQGALSRNVIAVLDTGTGKTLISVLVIQHILQIEKEFHEMTGKRRITFFLVNLVPLVTQQAQVLSNNLPVRVKQYCGELKVDSWNIEKWRQEFREAEVMVMTAQILLNIMRHGFISMKEINLLVFDECHHARKNHPYNLIMREFYDRSLPMERPKIFGMTASPNSSKTGVSFSASSLETNLASKIVTVDETQIQDFVNRPKEYFIKYSPSPQYTHTPLYQSFEEEFQNVDILKRAFSVADLILHELGPWCSDHVWEYMLAIIQESLANPLYLTTHPNIEFEQMVMNRSLDVLKSNLFHAPKLSLDCVSPKVLKLIEVLRFYEKAPTGFCGIIFVEKRFTAYALKVLINGIPGFEFLKLDILVGHGTTERGDIRMKFKEQNRIIEKFKSGELNLLIATSVAEEGLDIQPCNLVIRFDFFHSLTGYIQSRGRARQKNSKYVIMVEKGNAKQGRLYCEIRKAEEDMKGWCLTDAKLRAKTQEMSISEEETKQTIYISPKTGAICSLNSSVALVHSFCSLLNNDPYCDPLPNFEMTNEGSGFVCRLIMPKNSPIREVTGDFVPSKRLAKQSAALKACIQLHELGALDDRLLPINPNQDDEDEDDPDDAPDSLEGTWKSRRDYAAKSPNFWSIGDSETNTNNLLYMSIVTINNSDATDASTGNLRALGIITCGKPLEIPSFNLYVKDVPHTVKFSNGEGHINLDDEQIGELTKYTSTLFSLLLRKQLAHPSSNFQYFIAPLSRNDSTSIDWDEVHAGTSDKTLPIDYSIDRDIVIVDEFEYQRRYFLKNIHWDLSPESQISPNRGIVIKDSKYAHVGDYYEQKYKKTIVDWKQPILEVEEALKTLNFLIPVSTASPKIRLSSNNFIIPEFSSKLPIPASTFRSAMYLPSILTRVNSILLVKELKEKLDLDVDDILLMEAFSIPSASLDINYERLETLGDSFLKLGVSIRVYLVYPSKQEGQLHCQRIKSISNCALFRNAVKLELNKYVTSAPFNRKHWLPPNFVIDSASDLKRTSGHTLSDKTMADLVEACLGACYLSSGEESALDCAIKMMIPFPEIKHWREFATLSNLPPQIRSDGVQSQNFNFEEIEDLLDYKFQDPRILLEAFTHPSYPNPSTPCYQRLEFLGDAVLDFLVVSYIYDKYTHSTPAEITNLKSASVSNTFLSVVSHSLGLHKHLVHFSSLLDMNITEFVNQLEKCKSQAEEQGSNNQYWLHLNPPKAIADLIESLFGAIFVDSKFSLPQVKKTFDQHIKPFLEKYIRPGVVEVHPVVKLTMMIQKMGCMELTLRNSTGMSGDSEIQKCDIFIHDTSISTGSGVVVRSARKEAASLAMDKLNTDPEYFEKLCKCPRRKQSVEPESD